MSQFQTEGTVQRASTQAVLPIIILIMFALSTWIAVTPILVPPAVIPATAPAGEFSGERAFAHLRVIAGEPHTVGSPAQARVRGYLVQQIQAMGLNPVVQDATAALPVENGVFASNLHNILVRIPGRQSTGAVGIMAHYDSQPSTTGASDDGAAVAGILESMRAIQAGPQLRNDLIFILTDAEEVDAQGADAFFWQHPWTKDLRVLVNFEAAGNSGASMLLEITPGNRGLVESYLEGVAHPVGYSFLTDLLNIMPLGTDMTIFADHGIPCLSPMFGWGYHEMYHTWLDSVNTLDPRSIQHQGENGLGLARIFGSQDLAVLDTQEDQVFFVLFPGVMVHYPAGWSVALAGLVSALLLGVLVMGFARRQFSVLGILGGLLSALAAILLPVILAGLAWVLVANLNPEFWRNLMGSPYQSELYLLGMVALVAAFAMSILRLVRSKVSLAHFLLGAILPWLALAWLTSISQPGMSYLFTLPALCSTLLLGTMIAKPAAGPEKEAARASWGQIAVSTLAGAANILIVAPIITLLFMLMGFWFLVMDPSLPFIIVPLLFVALLAGLLAPQLDVLVARRAGRALGIGLLLAIGLLTAASLASGFGPTQPMQNGVWYRLDTDSQEAAWYSFGQLPADPWTAQFFPGATEPVDPAALYGMLPDNPYPPAAFKGPAPAANLPAPELTVLSDQVVGSTRTIALHLASPRLARGMLVKVSGAAVLSAAVNQNRQTNPAWADCPDWYLRFYGVTAGGVELVLEVSPSTEVTVTVIDQSDGLPELPGLAYIARTPDMMPFAIPQEYMPYPETTSVQKRFTLP